MKKITINEMWIARESIPLIDANTYDVNGKVFKIDGEDLYHYGRRFTIRAMERLWKEVKEDEDAAAYLIDAAFEKVIQACESSGFDVSVKKDGLVGIKRDGSYPVTFETRRFDEMRSAIRHGKSVDPKLHEVFDSLSIPKIDEVITTGALSENEMRYLTGGRCDGSVRTALNAEKGPELRRILRQSEGKDLIYEYDGTVIPCETIDEYLEYLQSDFYCGDEASGIRYLDLKEKYNITDDAAVIPVRVREDGTIDPSLSSFYHTLIKEAGKCEYYASDIAISIHSLQEKISEGSAPCEVTEYFGFRDLGVDHEEFIRQWIGDENAPYRSIYRIKITVNDEIQEAEMFRIL